MGILKFPVLLLLNNVSNKVVSVKNYKYAICIYRQQYTINSHTYRHTLDEIHYYQHTHTSTTNRHLQGAWCACASRQATSRYSGTSVRRNWKDVTGVTVECGLSKSFQPCNYTTVVLSNVSHYRWTRCRPRDVTLLARRAVLPWSYD